MKIENAFQIVAVIMAVVAAYFLWTGNKDGAFVSVVAGCVSFFLSIRFQVKARNKAREDEALSQGRAGSGGSGGSSKD